MLNIDRLIDENRMSKSQFIYFFKVHEDEEVVVFASVIGYELEEEDITSGAGRVFQVETAVKPKSESVVYWLGDNNGFSELNDWLSNKLYWTIEELALKFDVEEFKDISTNTSIGNYYWRYYV